MNIKEKLFRVQQELKAPKGNRNDFGGFNYRSCEDIQEAVKPILQEVKAVLVLSDDIVSMGNRFYIRATAKLCDIESDDEISNTAYARECESKPKMDTAQITGSCSSYARKYALNGLLCIDDTKDPDSMDNSKQNKQAESKKMGPSGKKQGKPPEPKPEREEPWRESERKHFNQVPDDENITKEDWSVICRAGNNNAAIIQSALEMYGYTTPSQTLKKDLEGILETIAIMAAE